MTNSFAAQERAWLDYMDVLLDKPEVDVLSHPFRRIADLARGQVSDDTIACLLRWVEERKVTLELNSHANTPETAEVRMLRIAADRGLPVVIGTDSHQCAQATNFSIALQRLALAGLAPRDLYMPEVEDFSARKGRRNTAASRLSKADSVRGQAPGVRRPDGERGVPAALQARDAHP